MYYSNCDKCSIIISVSTYASGDPDLYINYGDTRLPTKEDHDLSRTTFKSEIIELNLDSFEFFKKNKIYSMKGPFIIGIYGKLRTTYTISITS
jgi:hypothetical protein